MKRKRLNIGIYIITTAAALLFSVKTYAESGYGACPFFRPECCDNILFGCETFDLPEGCSCSDYDE